MANRCGNNGNRDRLYLLGLQNHCRWWLQPQYWVACSLEENYDKSRQCIKKQRHYFADKGLSSQSYRRRQWHPTPVLLPGKSHGRRSLVGCSPWVAESWTRLSDFTFTFHFHALEKEMATHSSVLACRIAGIGEPDGLPSMGLHRVGHNWSDLAAAAATQLNSILLVWVS